MNVQDTSAPPVTGDRLEMIFARQEELFQKYHPIEKANGIGHGAMTGPFDIDDPRCQYLCKDFSWRVAEEMAESTEAWGNQLHIQEEAADALHFLVELYLINGLSARDVFEASCHFPQGDAVIDSLDMLGHIFAVAGTPDYGCQAESARMQIAAYGVVEKLGWAMNCLKNKPWKQTHVLTDVKKYRLILSSVLLNWVIYAKTISMTAEITYDLYFRKSNVNSFRIGSNY